MNKTYNIQVDQNFIDAVAKVLKNEQPKEDNSNKVERYYTVSQIASMVQKSALTIRRHIDEEILVAEKIGKSWLIHQENLNKYLKLKPKK
jgi:excisionase family DNA binding protein